MPDLPVSKCPIIDPKQHLDHESLVSLGYYILLIIYIYGICSFLLQTISEILFILQSIFDHKAHVE